MTSVVGTDGISFTCTWLRKSCSTAIVLKAAKAAMPATKAPIMYSQCAGGTINALPSVRTSKVAVTVATAAATAAATTVFTICVILSFLHRQVADGL